MSSAKRRAEGTKTTVVKEPKPTVLKEPKLPSIRTQPFRCLPTSHHRNPWNIFVY